MSNITADELIKQFDLQPHPQEGGYYFEYYRDNEKIPKSALSARYTGDRCYSTAIYYLLPEGHKSPLHRVKSTEIWHFYLGDPVTFIVIPPEGKVQKIVLGQNLKEKQKIQQVVPSGYWFGAYPNPGSRFSFLGITVAPGFDFADFEMGKRADLLKQFPQAREEIEFLTDPL